MTGNGELFRTAACAAVFAFLSAATAFASGTVVWRASFDDASSCPVISNYQNRVQFAFGQRRPGVESTALVVGGTATGACDTAWCVRMGRVRLPAPAPKFALTFVEGAKGVRKRMVTGEDYDSGISWYDAAGREIGRSRFFSAIRPGHWKVGYSDVIPKGATAFELQLGFDGPDIPLGGEVYFGDVKLKTVGADAPCGFRGPDVQPPAVRMTSVSPTADALAPVSFSITDGSDVAWEKVAVKLDGKVATERFVRRGNEFALNPAEPWTRGLHRLSVHVEDVHGNAHDAEKVFLVGEPPKTRPVTLRDDGMTLVDGKPYFPIGIYNVRKLPFNAWDFRRAFADLRNVGFNLAHSYRQGDFPGFAENARAQGFGLWRNAFEITDSFVTGVRNDPLYVAWYLGDDTADWVSPEGLRDRDENAHAVDPTRITVQADACHAERVIDRYEFYAGATDVFMPEIYPVRETGPEPACVARVVSDMRRIASDNARARLKRPCGVWPIIGNFMGWKAWKRFPTPRENYAMSFAALANGAHGIIWYTYGPTLEPDPLHGRFDSGIACDETAWVSATNVSVRIRSLVPFLTERTVPFAEPEVLLGPKVDVRGNPAVTAALKCRGEEACLIAVNATESDVRVRFAANGSGESEVLWENRSVRFDGGAITDSFAPFGVHVYRFRISR